ncbi:uncharacterized protein BJ212DRAFT_1450041 [Suillus subaureus]|uniref:Uncharacterized protein n=1 Tax=Suillus subaureus TaxID=48587 RepID=A0A9P7DSC8_9AGAM|nr:uncharacterized protein BJ212DRAFT_1450041 [Suillus subaureus]KAG1801850.1 hypothetical protein BJ212DRAFT_1450041 [Suillus subaureus]
MTSLLHRECCTLILVEHCPASLDQGGNIHVATDGNFHHHHRHSAGDCPRFYEPSYYLPKMYADLVGSQIVKKWKCPAMTWAPNLIPNEVINQCENSYEAANGKKQKPAMDNTSITSCLHFAMMAMHAYGHKWGCQLIYNPCMCSGLSLLDGEGTDVNCQAAAIGAEMCADLSDWVKRQIHDIKTQTNATQDVLTTCVLALQADMATSDQALQTTCTMLKREAASDNTMVTLDGLERGHQCLMEKVEALYALFNIQDRFPELQGVNLNFVHTLLMAHDLKINICKHAIGSFFEWDKLDRAVGGAQQALGMKLHQQTHKAIAKRQPALMTAICKFNSYCEHLDSLYDPSWGIPLPMALPTKLADLHNDQTLMEDIWIMPSAGDIPHWLNDSDMRDGIRTLLKHDQCQEEQQCLSIEADNLCSYFGDELSALELTLSSDANHFLQLQSHWVNPFASVACFSSHAREASDVVKTLTGDNDIPDFEAGPSDVDAHLL